MSLLKNHEWRYLNAPGKNVFITQLEGDDPYFIHLDGEDRVQKEVFESDLQEDGSVPEHAVKNPKLLKNTIYFEEEKAEIDMGYIFRWES